MVAFKLLYFSLVTMTTTGFGLIKPQHWAPQIVVTVQMIISTVYTIVIFGTGLSRFFKSGDGPVKWRQFRRVSADFDINNNGGDSRGDASGEASLSVL